MKRFFTLCIPGFLLLFLAYPSLGQTLAFAEIINADNAAGDSIAVCPGEEVEFYGYGEADSGNSIESLIWNFGDGVTDSTNNSTVFHSFPEPGYFPVILECIDNLGQSATKQLNVYVSTHIEFISFPGDTAVCVSTEEFNLSASPELYSDSWSEAEFSVCVENNCMPAYVVTNTDLEISGYDSNLTLSSLYSIEKINIDIEHDYVGDIALSVICPNGSEMILSFYAGYGKDLGIPIWGQIDCDDPSTFGEAWTYSFSPYASDSWLDLPIGLYTIPEGTYQSFESFNKLIGCPINGTWSLSFIDNHGSSDDGSIPCWSIDFNNNFSSEINGVEYTNFVGLGPDSSYWDTSQTNLSSISENGNTITIDPQVPGVFEYHYEVTNNFGCSLDTSLFVSVYDFELSTEIEPNDYFLCDGEGYLSSEIIDEHDFLFTYQWSPNIGLSDPNQPTTDIFLDQDSTTYTISAYPLGMTNCLITEEITLRLDTSINAGLDTELDACWNDESFSLSEYLLDGSPDNDGIWTNSFGDIISSFDPASPNDSLFYYTVANNENGCFKDAELKINVKPYGDPTCCSFFLDYEKVDISCYGDENASLTFQVAGLESEGPFELTMVDPEGNNTYYYIEDLSNIENLQNLEAGAYYYELSSSVNLECIVFDSIFINEPSLFEISSQTDATLCVDEILELQLGSSGGNGGNTYYWTNMQGGTFESEESEVIYIDSLTIDQSTYSVYAIDQNNCVSNEVEIVVDLIPPITISMSEDTSICYDVPLIMTEETVSGGNNVGGSFSDNYSLSWYAGNGSFITNENNFFPQEEGWFIVEVQDNCSPAVQSSVYITLGEYPTDVNFTSDVESGCQPLEVQFFALINDAELGSVEWHFANLGNSNEVNPNFIFDEAGYHSITMFLTTAKGCEVEVISDDHIHVIAKPEAHFEYTPANPTTADPIVTFYNLSSNYQYSYWEFNYGDPSFGTSTSANPTFTFPDIAGTYTVFLEATQMQNCSDTILIDVTIEDANSIGLPGNFSPNGDGVNDFFGLSSDEISEKDFSMRIYDLLGNLVFASSNPDEKWDGTHFSNSSTLPMGVYVYKIQYSLKSASDLNYLNAKVLLSR